MAKQLNVNLAFTADTSQAAAQVRNLQTQLTNLINQPVGIGTKMTAEIQSAVSAAAELKVHLQNATNVKTGTLDFGRLNQSLKASGTSLSQYAAKLQSIGPQGQQAFMSLARSVANAEVPLRRSNALLQQFGTTLANTARWQLSSSLLHGFISSVSTAWRYSQDLNESLNNIRIVTGKNIEEMSRFADQANRAAKALSTTTTEYTNASLIYYQQGLSDAEVLGRTETTIKMANASRQSAEIVSDQMTAIWNNFYDGSKSLEYYADVVTALGAATASSSEEIATGLEKFAAVAETVGLSYEYATSALATITATTRQSADIVGTALKTLFARLSDLKLGETLEDGTTLGQYSENLAKVGVNIKDASGQLKDMDTILNETAAKWDTLDRAQQTALAKGVAGIRQYTQFIALMDNWDFMEKNLATASGSSGTLQKQADIYAESWEAARDRVTASLEVIYESIMDDEFFIELTNGFAKLTDGVGGFVKSIGGLQGVLSGLGLILTKVFSEQLTAGFANLAYNMKMSTETGRQLVQQEKLKEMQGFAQNVYGMEGPAGTAMSTVYSEELTMQTQLLQNAKNLTAEEKAKLDLLMQSKQTMGDQAIQLAQQSEELKNQAILLESKVMQTSGIAYNPQTFAAFRKGMDEIGQVEGILQGVASSAKISTEQMDILAAALKRVGYSDKDISDLKDRLVGMAGSSDTAAEAMTHLYSELEKIKNEKISTIVGEKEQYESAAAYEYATGKVRAWGVALTESGQKQGQSNITVKNGKHILEEYMAILDQTRTKTMSTAQAFTQMTSGLMSAGMFVSSMQGLTEAISNPDLSGWERFGQVLTSISMITFSLTGIWKGFTGLITVGTKLFTTDTVAVHANAWAKELAAKQEERLTAAKTKGTIIQRIKSALNKDEIADDTKDAATTTAAAAAQEGENAEIRENIALELARQKMGLSKSRSGRTFYQTDKKGFRQPISEKRYNTLLQQGRKGVTNDEINANLPPTTPQGPIKKSAWDKGTIKTIGKHIGGYAIIAAAIAAAAFIVKTASDYYNRFEIEAKKAEETARSLQKTYEEVQSAESEFRSGIESYESAVDSLDELTAGTEDYKKAVVEANNAAIKLLNTHKNLKYTINDDGLIEIDQASLLAAQRESLQKEARAQAAAMSAQQDAKTARLEADKVNFQRTKMKAGGASWDEDDTTAVAGGVGAGAALAGGAVAYTAIAAGNAWNPVGWAMLIAGAVAAVVGVGIATFNNDADAREAQTLDALEQLSIDNGGRDLKDTEIEAEANKLDQSGELAKSLLEDIDATNEMIAEMRANTEAINHNNELIASQLFQNNDYIMNSDNADEVIERSGLFYGQAYDDALAWVTSSGWGKEGIAKIDGANAVAKEVWADYLKYAGLTDKNWQLVDTKGTDENRIFVYLDEQGQRQEKTLAEMQKMYASWIATTKTEANANKLVSYFKEWSSKEGAADQAIASFLMNGNFEDTTKTETEAVQNEINTQYGGNIEDYLKAKLGDLNAAAEKLGYDNANALVNAFSSGLTNNLDTIWGSIDLYGFNEILSKNMQVSTAQAFENAIKLMNSGPLGEKAGKMFTDHLNNLMVNVTPEDQEAALKRIAEIDWSQWDAAEQIVDIMRDLGYEVDTTSAEWSNFVMQMNVANGAVFDHAQALKDISKMTELVNNLSIGDIVSKEDYDILVKYNNEIERYFRLLGDGTYKLVGDPLDLIQEIGKGIDASYGAAVSGAKANYDTFKFRDTVSKNVEATGYSRNQLSSTSAGVVGSKGEWVKNPATFDTYFKWLPNHILSLGDAKVSDFQTSRYVETEIQGIKDVGLYNAQIDFIDQYLEGYTDEQIQAWRDAANDPQSQKAIDAANQVSEVVNKYLERYPAVSPTGLGAAEQALKEAEEKMLSAEVDYATNARSNKELDMMYEQGQIGDRAYNTAQLEFAQQEKWEGVDPNEVEQYADALLKAAKNSELLDDNMSAEAAEDVALYVKKMNQGVDKLKNSFKDWNSILTKSDKGSEEYIKAMADMKDAMSDVLGVNEDFISNKFILDHMEDIEKAATGDAKAIDDLAAALGRELILDFTIDSSQAEKDALAAHDALQIKLSGKEVGFSVTADMDTEGIIKGAQEVINSAEMTVAEAQAYFNSLGYEPVFVTEEKNVDQSVPITVTRTEEIEPFTDSQGKTWSQVKSYSYQDGVAKTSGKMEVVAMSSDGKTPKIKELRKKSSGAMNNFSGANKGGSSGGGGGGSKKKDKSKEKERYHDIKTSLDKLSKSYDAISKARERAFGADKLKLLEQEQQVLEDQLDTQRQYIAEIEDYYNKDRSALEAYGATFAEDGTLLNYEALMDEYIEKFNSGAIDEEAYNAFKEAISQYEKTWNLLIDEKTKEMEQINKLYDFQLEKIKTKLELDLSLVEDQLELLKYQLENIEDAAYDAAEAFALLSQKATEIQNKTNTTQSALAEFLTQRGITDINDESQWVNAKLTAAEIEWLRAQKTELLNTNKELRKLKQEAIDQAIAAYDEWNTKIDENIEKFKHYSSIVESFKNIIDIIGKDTLGIANETLAALTQVEVDNATNKLTAAKEKLDASKQAESELLSKMIGLDKDSEEYKILEQTLKHIQEQTAATEEEMMSSWEEALQSAADAFEQAVERSISIFEKAMAGTYGSLDELQKAFEQSNEVSERYVEDYKKIYELSKLNRDVMKSIDETDNVKAKQALRNLQKEINNLQNSNTKMSQYELDHARKKYELRLAEIALEDAQNAKSQVRMRRDSEGNYSYVFTADQNAIDEAQQNYEDKLYEMQELNTKYIKEMQNNILQSEIELTNALRELDRTKFASDAEYYAKVNELTNYYTGQRNYALEEANKGILNNKELVDQDWANYSAATGYKISADADFVDSFDETTYAQLAGYTTIEEAQTRFVEASTMMITDLNTAFTQWQTDLDRIMSAAGSSVAGFGDQMNTTVYGDEENDGIIDASNMATASVKSLADQMLDTFSTKTLSSLSDFAKNYQAKIRPVIETNEALVNTLNEFIARQAAMNTRSSVYTGINELPNGSNQGTKTGDLDLEQEGNPNEDYTNKFQLLSGYKAFTKNGNFFYQTPVTLSTKDTYTILNEARNPQGYDLQGNGIRDDFYLIKNDQKGYSYWVTKQHVKSFNPTKLDTGGYTGDWGNNEGRLAVLHKKELILNPEDTENMLSTIELVRNIARIIDLNAGVQSLGLGYLSASSGMDNSQVLEQQVTIHAEFPEAQDRNEIKEAFSMLINEASQFANRKNL